MFNNIKDFDRFFVGFDPIVKRMSEAAEQTVKAAQNYPPYNIIKVDENNWAIQVAVAGFGEDELDIERKDNVLHIKGERKVKDEQEYVHRGISARAFNRSFTLNENVEVKGATVINGILAISLEHIVPEEQKPKKIAITFAK